MYFLEGQRAILDNFLKVKVKIEGVHPSAYKAVLMAQPKPGESRRSLAQDSTLSEDILDMFPDAHRIT